MQLCTNDAEEVGKITRRDGHLDDARFQLHQLRDNLLVEVEIVRIS